MGRGLPVSRQQRTLLLQRCSHNKKCPRQQQSTIGAAPSTENQRGQRGEHPTPKKPGDHIRESSTTILKKKGVMWCELLIPPSVRLATKTNKQTKRNRPKKSLYTARRLLSFFGETKRCSFFPTSPKDKQRRTQRRAAHFCNLCTHAFMFIWSLLTSCTIPRCFCRHMSHTFKCKIGQAPQKGAWSYS